MNGSSLVFLHSLQFTLPSNLNSSELFSWDGHWMTFSFRFWRGRSVGRKPVGPLRPTRGASVAVASQWSRAKAGPDQNMMSSKWIQIAGDLYKTHMGEWKTSLNRTLAHVFFFNFCFELFLFAMSLHKLVLQVGSFVERAPVGRLPGARTRRWRDWGVMLKTVDCE